MTEDLRPPFRQQFDSARDPYTARNALGITSTGGSGGFITAVTPPLQVTGTTLSIDLSAYLTTASAAATYQPLDADLTAIAALTGTNVIYYRSAANTWTAVTIGTGLSFTSGTLANTVASGAPVGAEYITSTSDATLTSERVLTDTATVTWDRTTAGQIKANAAGGGTATPGPPQGRLTLQTATPVMTTTQSAKTTIFYTPYVGNQVPIWDGTTMTMTTFAELSNVTTASSTGNAGPAAVAASSVYDLFVWNNSGTITLTRGPVWTSDTARSAGTALVMVSGVLLNNASITNGPAASRGTYVGTTRSNGSSQLDWIYGAFATTPTAGFFGVWNMYNRRLVASIAGDTTNTWTYALAAVRAARAQATLRHSFVSGLAEDNFEASYTVHCQSTAGVAIGICYDVTNAFSGITGFVSSTGPSASVAGLYASTALGFHFFQAGESATSTTTANFWGGFTDTTVFKSGTKFSGWM